jgi:N-methylhydantoinase B
MKKTRTPGWGLDGGWPGPGNVSVLIPATDTPDWKEHWERDIIVYADNGHFYQDREPDQVYCGMFRGQFSTGDVISYLADGGGGYGHPFLRDPERVRDDVLDGYVSREAAARDYGVILTDAGEIDAAATHAARASDTAHADADRLSPPQSLRRWSR